MGTCSDSFTISVAGGINASISVTDTMASVTGRALDPRSPSKKEWTAYVSVSFTYVTGANFPAHAFGGTEDGVFSPAAPIKDDMPSGVKSGSYNFSKTITGPTRIAGRITIFQNHPE